MLEVFRKRKIVLVAVGVGIVSIGVLFFAGLGVSEGGAGVIIEAWRSVFGPADDLEMEISLDVASSSTLSELSASTEPSGAGSATWPTLLIDKSAAKSVVNKASPVLGPAAIENSGDTGNRSATGPVDKDISVPEWCSFDMDASSEVKVIFNEVAWMGSGSGSGDEWLELRNTSGQIVDLNGWQILNDSGSIKINVGNATGTTSNGLFLLEREKGYSGALANSGTKLKLFDGDCKVSDAIDASGGWPAGDNETKFTMERDADGVGWHSSAEVGGTPGRKNSVPVVFSPKESPDSTNTETGGEDAQEENSAGNDDASSSAQNSSEEKVEPGDDEVDGHSESDEVVGDETSSDSGSDSSNEPAEVSSVMHPAISAVHITGGVGKSAQDYIKIYNPTGSEVDMSGWKLRKRAKSGAESSIRVLPSSSIVLPDSYFTWANSVDGFSETVNASVSSTQTIAADNSVALLDVENNLIDAVAWGSGHTDPYIEGEAYPNNPGPDQVLSRRIIEGIAQDTGSNSYDFEIK